MGRSIQVAYNLLLEKLWVAQEADVGAILKERKMRVQYVMHRTR